MQMAKINKTNACRILDQKKIAYELIPYEVDENDLGAQHIADQLGEDIDQVFKTLVLKGDKIGHFVCVIPGNDELDLKKTAKATGNKSCDLIPMKELLPLTGYIRGGCSPVGIRNSSRLSSTKPASCLITFTLARVCAAYSSSSTHRI